MYLVDVCLFLDCPGVHPDAHDCGRAEAVLGQQEEPDRQAGEEPAHVPAHLQPWYDIFSRLKHFISLHKVHLFHPRSSCRNKI